jgi:5-(carboxyamino)imidazole ribonucleotide synthase
VPLAVTQDRLAERRFIEHAGVEVAPWREVRTDDDLRAAAAELGLPLRLKAATGGYDGRGQLRLATAAELDGAIDRLGRTPGAPQLAERELAFAAEISVVVARGTEGRMSTFPIARNVHDAGILAESVAPAPVLSEIAERAVAIGERLALAMGLVGTLTAELFLMPDGRVLVNELAPRVHNSGHWTIEGARTSQFEQHLRAVLDLPLGDTRMTAPHVAMSNVLGGDIAEMYSGYLHCMAHDPGVHIHMYGKDVRPGRKVGHVTTVGDHAEDVRARAVHAAAFLRGDIDG